MFTTLLVGLTLLQVKALSFMCVAEGPEGKLQLTCAIAIDGKVVNTVSSPIMDVDGPIPPQDLAAAYCSGIHDLLGVSPRPPQHI